MKNPAPDDLTSQLVALQPDAVGDALEAVDGSEPATAAAVLAAAAVIAQEYVLPAEPSLIRSDNGWSHFDLDVVAGYEVPGLIGGILKTRFPNLTKAPPAEILAQDLEAAGFDIDDPERRRQFFAAWMAQRASHMVDDLVGSVASRAIASHPHALDSVEALAGQDLPGATRLAAARLLAAAAPGRALTLRNATTEPFLREIIDECLASRSDGLDTDPPNPHGA